MWLVNSGRKESLLQLRFALRMRALTLEAGAALRGRVEVMESIFFCSKNHRGRLGELVAVASETCWTRGAAVLQPGYPAGGGSCGLFSAERGHGEYAALGSHLPESLAIRRPTLSGAPRLEAGGPAGLHMAAVWQQEPFPVPRKAGSRTRSTPGQETEPGGRSFVEARLRSGGNPGMGPEASGRGSLALPDHL